LSATAALARASLFGALVVLSSTGCLITSTPTYDTPQQTPPLLLAADAKPVITEAQPVVVSESTPPLNFSASVISEDNNQQVQLALLIDYGVEQNGNPYRGGPEAVHGMVLPNGIGTLAEGPRLTQSLQLESTIFTVVSAGTPPQPVPTCHTVTMVATHEFGDANTGCPRCLVDSSMLTWTIIACPGPGTSCPPIDISGMLNNCDALLAPSKLSNGCPREDDDAGTCPFPSPPGTTP
jgi:hypothetical protein